MSPMRHTTARCSPSICSLDTNHWATYSPPPQRSFKHTMMAPRCGSVDLDCTHLPTRNLEASDDQYTNGVVNVYDLRIWEPKHTMTSTLPLEVPSDHYTREDEIVCLCPQPQILEVHLLRHRNNVGLTKNHITYLPTLTMPTHLSVFVQGSLDGDVWEWSKRKNTSNSARRILNAASCKQTGFKAARQRPPS